MEKLTSTVANVTTCDQIIVDNILPQVNRGHFPLVGQQAMVLQGHTDLHELPQSHFRNPWLLAQILRG